MTTFCEYNDDGVCEACGVRRFLSPSPRMCRMSHAEPQQESSVKEMPLHGPGTELSKLLKRFGIEPTPTCACRAKQQEMDLWGCDECERPERIDEVIAVMRAEATARGLPFIDAAGRFLIKRAIKTARKSLIDP